MMMNYFPDIFLNEMPKELLDIPSRVQELTGIEVRIKEFNSQFMQNNPMISKSPAALDINPDEHSITIWVRDQLISPKTIGHELIHLRRNIIESVPKLFPLQNIDLSVSETVYLFENELEHLIIVPEEINLFPESESFWASYYDKVIEGARGKKTDLCFHWIFLIHVLPKHEKLVNKCAKLIRELNDKEFSIFIGNLRENISEAIPDKLRMLESLLEASPDIAKQSGVGQYFTKNGQLYLRPL